MPGLDCLEVGLFGFGCLEVVMVCLVWAGYRFGWFVWFGLAIGLDGLSGLAWL